jgi:hypothetical protein
VYIADARGQIRHHQFGEGGYEECERVIQRLLREAGVDGVGDALAAVAPGGFEAQADWTNLASPETYLGPNKLRTSSLQVALRSMSLERTSRQTR